MNDLAPFSEWALALLPRLFLYPGGLWLLVVILGLRLTLMRRGAGLADSLQSNLMRADLLALASAWTAVSLLPLHGATPLPFPTDRLALAGLLAVSLAFDTSDKSRIEIAILAAVVAPIAAQRTLLDTNIGLSGWISLLAVLVGTAALAPHASDSLSLAARLVAYLGLASTPLWALPRLQDPLRLLAAFSLLIVVTAIVGRIAHTRIKPDWSMVLLSSLAAFSLLAALLLPA